MSKVRKINQRRKQARSKRGQTNGQRTEWPRLGPPIVVAELLSDPKYLSFADFLRLPETRALFGLNNDTAVMLGGLVKEREFLLARASKHPKHRAQWRRMLGDYVRRTYFGDARGLLYWRRVAKVIWIAYENLLRLKLWAARTRTKEEARLERWEARAEKERARQRARRAKAKGARKHRASTAQARRKRK